MGETFDEDYVQQSFAGVIADQYAFNFKYWSYNSTIVSDFEDSLIKYFTSDSARLIAPILAVSVTA
jgi:hypothetical protein